MTTPNKKPVCKFCNGTGKRSKPNARWLDEPCWNCNGTGGAEERHCGNCGESQLPERRPGFVFCGCRGHDQPIHEGACQDWIKQDEPTPAPMAKDKEITYWRGRKEIAYWRERAEKAETQCDWLDKEAVSSPARWTYWRRRAADMTACWRVERDRAEKAEAELRDSRRGLARLLIERDKTSTKPEQKCPVCASTQPDRWISYAIDGVTRVCSICRSPLESKDSCVSLGSQVTANGQYTIPCSTDGQYTIPCTDGTRSNLRTNIDELEEPQKTWARTIKCKTQETCDEPWHEESNFRCQLPKGHDGPHFSEHSIGSVRWPVSETEEGMTFELTTNKPKSKS